MIVDNFAGGGGASTGIEVALGRSPDIAINHDAEAIAMHIANHPRTRHYLGDVWDVYPATACAGQTVDLAWFSPDCKHFSRAKGGAIKRSKEIRGLAWVVVRWAKAVRPKVIILENVEEFQGWGPLLDDGRPDPARKGETFAEWRAALEAEGYKLELKQLKACDYGAPTSRKRLFVIARCDGQPIVWPEPTHGPGQLPYRTAADCIDWSVPTSSIFARDKPLAEKTQARIARGVSRFVVNAAEPFIVPLTHGGGLDRVHGINEPLRTVTAAHRGEMALVVPTLIPTGYGERVGQTPRALDIRQPLGTVVAGGAKHALVTAFLARHYGGNENDGTDLRRPMHTVTCQDHHSLVTVGLERWHADSKRRKEVHDFLARFEISPYVAIDGVVYEIVDIGMRMLTPRELFRAQGFPDSYVIDPVVDGKRLSKTAQIRMCGNSVCPPLAAALAGANVPQALQEVA